MNKALA